MASASCAGSCCHEAGIDDEQSREVLVEFLHDLGVAVHFKDFQLNTFSVLDPKWVTHGVYAKQVADSKGVLHVDNQSATEAFSSLFELKPTLFGASVNLNEAFKRILVWDKQHQQQARKPLWTFPPDCV
ncbi:COR domain-containing protein [Candidatus Electronema sp. JM]|uniref:COR domain-containing protein n=1 Tax=Candidatus Electronema sp. JM TaxID=3401571 RepID=UPI003AA7F5AA